MTEQSSVTGPKAEPVPERAPRRSVPWLVMSATVVVGAGVQAATAAPGLGNESSGAFVVAALASLVAVVVEVALLAWAAHAVVQRSRLGRLPLGLVVWSLVVVLVLSVVSVLVAPAVLLVLVAALCVLPAAAAGERNALKGFRVFRAYAAAHGAGGARGRAPRRAELARRPGGRLLPHRGARRCGDVVVVRSAERARARVVDAQGGARTEGTGRAVARPGDRAVAVVSGGRRRGR